MTKRVALVKGLNPTVWVLFPAPWGVTCQFIRLIPRCLRRCHSFYFTERNPITNSQQQTKKNIILSFWPTVWVKARSLAAAKWIFKSVWNLGACSQVVHFRLSRKEKFVRIYFTCICTWLALTLKSRFDSWNIQKIYENSTVSSPLTRHACVF